MRIVKSVVMTSVLVIASTLALGCGKRGEGPHAGTTGAALAKASTARIDEGAINPRLLRRFQPVAPLGFDAPPNEALVELGHVLFFEPRISADSTLSCASCHDLAGGGADALATSVGVGGKHPKRNTPTVLNAAGAFTQLWDGRGGNVEEMAFVPLLSPAVMGMPDAATVVTRLRAIPGYEPLFTAAFPGADLPLSAVSVGRALGAYERTLSTPGRWDKFLAGDKSALDGTEKEGLRTFLNVGCMVCHTGPLVGGATFERVGVVEAWPNQADPGRMAVTKNEVDRMMFKVPTLRNVAKTAPYFHDASAATLPEAVKKMGKHQLGLDLAPREVETITAWLTALNGDAPAALIARPELPR